MITVDEVKVFQKSVGTASWKLDLWKFADAMGHNADHDYTKDKFREFSELNRALGRFDAETLTKILNAVE